VRVASKRVLISTGVGGGAGGLLGDPRQFRVQLEFDWGGAPYFCGGQGGRHRRMSLIADGCCLVEEVVKPVPRHHGRVAAGVPGGDLYGAYQGDGLGIAVLGAAGVSGGGQQELDGVVSGEVHEQRASGGVGEVPACVAGGGCPGRGLLVVAEGILQDPAREGEVPPRPR